ncbi:MAG: hypothetical protein ACLP8S_11440 [Solirubrobacteraceae bacterium]
MGAGTFSPLRWPGGSGNVARRNRVADSHIKVKPRVALALACAQAPHELIDAKLEIVELAPQRLQAAAAHVRELRGDALRVLGPDRQLQPRAEP